jgi:predicted HAD superfamily Cof-like phosphohydrolase
VPLTPMEMLREWGNAVGERTAFFPHPDISRLRMRLLKEEHQEVRDELLIAVNNPVEVNRPALAKELADLLFVTYGTAAQFEIDLDYALREVYRSNMSKMDKNGRAIKDEGGKVLKGPSYTEPDLSLFAVIEGTCIDVSD